MDYKMTVSNGAFLPMELGQDLCASALSTSEYVTKSPAILKLSNEILLMIAAFVDRKSLPALRGTYKLFYNNSTRSFIDKFIKNFGVMMYRRGLQSLIDISKDAAYASGVRSVNLDSTSVDPYWNPEFQDCLEEQSVPIIDGEGLDMLTEALINFKRTHSSIVFAIHDQNIKPIGIANFRVTNGREWQWQPSLSLEVLETLSQAISRSRTNIKELDLWIGDEVKDWDTGDSFFDRWHAYGLMIDMFASLRVLKLHALHNCEQSCLLQDKTCYIITKLMGYARSLRVLHLGLDMEAYMDNGPLAPGDVLGFFSDLIHLLVLPRLAELQLDGALFKEVKLISFLSRHTQTLKALRLTKCCVVNLMGSWSSVYAWIKSNIKLESITIRLLFVNLNHGGNDDLHYLDHLGLRVSTQTEGLDEVQKYLDQSIVALRDMSL